MPGRRETHVVIRARPGIDAGQGAISTGSDYRGFPFEVSTEALNDSEAADLRREDRVEQVLPSISLSLIEPLDLFNLSQSAEESQAWGVAAVGADECEEDGRGVRLAILDSGIDEKHAAFARRKPTLVDFVADPRGKEGSAPDEPHGHGTHVAGTAFGGEVEGRKIGIAPGVDSALIVKVVGPKGAATETVVEGLNWALKNKADIISMSLGFDFPSLVTGMIELDYPLTIAVSRALASYRQTVGLFDSLADFIEKRVPEGKGAILVAASGNGSLRLKDPRFTAAVVPPAAAAGFISVGAVSPATGLTPPYAVAPFSNTGCRLMGPGERIVSARPGGGLRTLSGTSMAAPHVAGVAALWLQRLHPDPEARPTYWIDDIRRALLETALRLPGDREDVGLGLVQAPKPKGNR